MLCTNGGLTSSAYLILGKLNAFWKSIKSGWANQSVLTRESSKNNSKKYSNWKSHKDVKLSYYFIDVDLRVIKKFSDSGRPSQERLNVILSKVIPTKILSKSCDWITFIFYNNEWDMRVWGIQLRIYCNKTQGRCISEMQG